MTILKDNELLDLDPAGYEPAFVCHCGTVKTPHVHKQLKGREGNKQNG